MSVSKILSSLNSSGVAKASHYQIQIPIVDEDTQLRAINVTLPGRSVQATTYRDYGASREIAYLPLYTQASATFLCSADLKERLAFTQWQDKIIGPHRVSPNGYAEPFEAGYYDEYVNDVSIIQMDQTGAETYRCKLLEAYPRSISDISYSYAAEEIVTFSVQFQYRFFTEN